MSVEDGYTSHMRKSVLPIGLGLISGLVFLVGCTEASEPDLRDAEPASDQSSLPEPGDAETSGIPDEGSNPIPDTAGCSEPPCELGAIACDGDFGYRVCSFDSLGCIDFGPPVFCTPGASCVDGACLGECTIPRLVLLSDLSKNMADRWQWVEPGLEMGLGDGLNGAEVALVPIPSRDESENCLADIAIGFSQVSGVQTIIESVTPSGLSSGGLAIHDGLRQARELLAGGTDGGVVVLMLARPERCSDLDTIHSELYGLQALGAKVHVFWAGLPGDRWFADEIAEPIGATVRLPTNEFALSTSFYESLLDAGICCLDTDGDGYGAFCSTGPDCNEDNIDVYFPSCAGKECGDDGCGGSCGDCPGSEFGEAVCQDGTCGVACDDGYHPCNGVCVDNNGTAHCGDACSACPIPAGGSAECDGVQCLEVCSAEYHPCDGVCVSNTSIMHCGTSCEPCAQGEFATATCDGTNCGFTCEPGYLDCSGSCAPCPSTGVASLACSSSGACIAEVCEQGFLPCESGCCDFVSILAASAQAPATAGSWPSLAVTYDGIAHLAFYRTVGTGGEIVHATGDLEGFSEAVVASGGYSAFGRYPRMNLDLLDTPRVAYRGGASTSLSEIVVATFSEGLWSSQVLADSFGVFSYLGGDFDFSNDGLKPAVAYPAGSQLVISRVDGFTVTDWSVLSTPGESYDNGPSLSFDAAGIAHVVGVETAERVIYSSGGASTWSSTVVAEIAAVGGHRLSIAENDGDIAVCYLNNSASVGTGVFLARLSNDWNPVLIDPDANQACDVAFGDDGTTHVVYRRQAGALRHAWTTPAGIASRTLLEAPAPGIGYRWPAMALSDNVLHVTAWNQFEQAVIYLRDPLENLGQ